MPKFEDYECENGIQIFPLFNCNLKCSYCVNNMAQACSSNRKVMITQRTASEWTLALSRLRSNIKLWWLGGEPTLWPDLSKVSNALPHDQIILTNLYSEKSARVITRLDPDKVSVYVSLHPFGNDEYNLSCVSENLKYIMSRGFSLYGDAAKIVVPPGKDLPFQDIAGSKIDVLDPVGYFQDKFYVHKSNPNQGLRACAMDYTTSVICPVRNGGGYFSWLGPNGDLYSCYTGLVCEDKHLIIGNIFDNMYSSQKYVYCTGHYGKCEPCDFSTPVEISEGLAAPKTYGTAIGNWGDIILTLGLFKRKFDRGSILLYTFDPNIEKFVEAQDFVDEVLLAQPRNTEEYITCLNDNGYFNKKLQEYFNISSSQIDMTNLHASNHFKEYLPEVPRLRLPEENIQKAIDLAHGIDKPFILVCPYSYGSLKPEDQYKYWPEILEYLSSLDEYKFIIVGQSIVRYGFINGVINQDFMDNIDSKNNFINMIDKTDSNLDVFALASIAHGVITTSNGLGLWCGNQGLRHCIVKNKLIEGAPSSIFNATYDKWSPSIVSGSASLKDALSEIDCQIKSWRSIIEA